MLSFSCGHNGRGWPPRSSAFFKKSGQQMVFCPYREQRTLPRGSASLQGMHCSAAAWLLLRSHTRAVTQISSTFRHYPEVILCLQDSFPLQVFGENAMFSFYLWVQTGGTEGWERSKIKMHHPCWQSTSVASVFFHLRTTTLSLQQKCCQGSTVN